MWRCPGWQQLHLPPAETHLIALPWEDAWPVSSPYRDCGSPQMAQTSRVRRWAVGASSGGGRLAGVWRAHASGTGALALNEGINNNNCIHTVHTYIHMCMSETVGGCISAASEGVQEGTCSTSRACVLGGSGSFRCSSGGGRQGHSAAVGGPPHAMPGLRGAVCRHRAGSGHRLACASLMCLPGGSSLGAGLWRWAVAGLATGWMSHSSSKWLGPLVCGEHEAAEVDSKDGR